MAIYHLKHASVGRSTHAEGTAGAHVSYITRTGACREVVGSDMPIPKAGERGGEARTWLDQQERADRKNARVIDKVTVALPLELTKAQRVELVRAFAAEVTQGRVAWLAAIHDQDRDADNPHAHLVLRDRDLETGKMALRMSQKGSTEMLREKWEQVCNAALERTGSQERIDRRTLEAQGIDRKPTKHIGYQAQQIEADGRESWKLEALREETSEPQRSPQSAVEAPERGKALMDDLRAASERLTASEIRLSRAQSTHDRLNGTKRPRPKLWQPPLSDEDDIPLRHQSPPPKPIREEFESRYEYSDALAAWKQDVEDWNEAVRDDWQARYGPLARGLNKAATDLRTSNEPQKLDRARSAILTVEDHLNDYVAGAQKMAEDTLASLHEAMAKIADVLERIIDHTSAKADQKLNDARRLEAENAPALREEADRLAKEQAEAKRRNDDWDYGPSR